MNATQTLKVLMGANKDAVKVAGSMELGRTLNTQARKVLEKMLPAKQAAMLAFVPDSVVDIIISNIIYAGVVQFAPTNVKAGFAAEKMVQAAMYETVRSIDFPTLIGEFFEGFTDVIENTMLKEENAALKSNAASQQE